MSVESLLDEIDPSRPARDLLDEAWRSSAWRIATIQEVQRIANYAARAENNPQWPRSCQEALVIIFEKPALTLIAGRVPTGIPVQGRTDCYEKGVVFVSLMNSQFVEGCFLAETGIRHFRSERTSTTLRAARLLKPESIREALTLGEALSKK